MMPRPAGIGVAVLATFTLLLGFVAGSFFASGSTVAPSPVDPGGSLRRPVDDASPATRSVSPLDRQPARASAAVPAEYRVSDAELARARQRIDVAPDAAPEGTTRVTGVAATVLGEPLEGVLVVATLRTESDPYGEFSDGLGQGTPADPSLDDALAQHAESWARSRGSRYRGQTGAGGRYAIERLPAGRYRLSAYKAGYVLETSGSSYVDAGGTRDFIAKPVIEFEVNVRLPDGTEPPIASIRVTRSRDVSIVRWTPDHRAISLPAADGSAVALSDFVTGAAYGSDAPARLRSATVRLTDEQRTLDFHLEPQTGVYGRILDPAGTGSYREVALLDLSRDPTVSAAAFAAGSTRTIASRGVFEFMDLAPGSYAVGLLGNRDESLLASATVVVHDGLVEQHLELAPPTRDNSIRVLCLSPAGLPLYDVSFRYMVSGGNGRSSGSVSRPVRDAEGAYWIPTAAVGDFESIGDGARLRITAENARFGRCSGDLVPGARELTLRFAEPCRLIVTVPGYADSPYRGSLRVVVAPDPKNAEREPVNPFWNGESEMAAILDDGTAEFSHLSPGVWIAQLSIDGRRFSSRAIASARVDVRSGTQQVSLPIPPMYDVVVHAPSLEPGTNIWVMQVPDEGGAAGPRGMGFQQSARIDDQRRATLTQMPAGRYSVHANGPKPQDIDVPGGPYVLEALQIDCLRVAISDQDGVLYRAGLRPGDLVTSIDGVPFTASTWWKVLNEQGTKQRVPLTLVRDGRAMTLQGGDHPWNGAEVGGSYAPEGREGR